MRRGRRLLAPSLGARYCPTPGAQWGITLDGSSADVEESEATKAVNKGGLSFEYDAASAAPASAASAASESSAAAVPEADLSDLFAQLKSAQK